jgi:hypothetical protein
MAENLPDLPFHPVADVFPLLEGDEFRALVEDILAHGQREPIWTYQKKIIDGRNRYRACREAGVQPKTREWDGRGSLVAFVLSLNMHRRHLTSSQRAAVAAELLPLLETEAKERQRVAGGDRQSARGKARGSVPQKVAGAVGESRELAAKIAGTNKQYVSAAKRLKEGAPDLFEQVKRGELDVHQARNRARQRERVAESEAFHAPHPVGAGAFLELEHRPTWSERNREALLAEVAARPDFAAREAEARRLKAESERLRREAVEAERRHYDLKHQLDRDIYSTVCAEHGPIVGLGWSWYEVGEAERQRIEDIPDPEERYREVLWRTGHCLECGTKLKGSHQSAVCAWCDEHRGKTHCMDCGCPLSGDELDGWCEECDPPGPAVAKYLAELQAELAGSGQGNDAAKLDEKERARLRRQAREWLRADLNDWTQLLEKQPGQARAAVQQTLVHWEQDIDFAGVRGDGLSRLPEAERPPWQQLWADVDGLLQKASRSDSEDKKKGPSK